MDISMIEKLDRSRNNTLKWFTLGWAAWFGIYIFKEAINNTIITGILLLIGLIGWIIWTSSLIRFYRLNKIVRSDDNLKNALNDELHRHNSSKAIVTGFAIIMITIALFICVASFFSIATLLVLKIILYVGVLSVLIASLLYNRN